MERDEVVWANEGSNAELAPQPADGPKPEHSVATLVEEPLKVGLVIDPVWLHVRISVAGDQHALAYVQLSDVVAPGDAKPTHRG